MAEPRRVTLEVSDPAGFEWADVDRVVAYAESWMAEHSPGRWELADVARFDVGEGVRWMLGFLEVRAAAVEGLGGR